MQAREHIEDAQEAVNAGSTRQVVQQRRDRDCPEDRIETTMYVRNIYKYYVAYKLMEERREATRKAHKKVRRALAK